MPLRFFRERLRNVGACDGEPGLRQLVGLAAGAASHIQDCGRRVHEALDRRLLR